MAGYEIVTWFNCIEFQLIIYNYIIKKGAIYKFSPSQHFELLKSHLSNGT